MTAQSRGGRGSAAHIGGCNADILLNFLLDTAEAADPR